MRTSRRCKGHARRRKRRWKPVGLQEMATVVAMKMAKVVGAIVIRRYLSLLLRWWLRRR